VQQSISITLPGDLKEELDRVTEAEGVSQNELVREAVREYLFIRRLRSLRRRLMPYAEAQGVLTDEDVFREIS
jgi:metal-responsive CopG/Arc/MetJ family transcriptional regulator